MPKEFELIRENSGLDDRYVLAYDDEPRILSCLIKSLFPEGEIKDKKVPGLAKQHITIKL